MKIGLTKEEIFAKAVAALFINSCSVIIRNQEMQKALDEFIINGGKS